MNDFMSIRRAAKRLGFPPTRLYAMRRAGQLPGIMMGRSFYVDVQALSAYLTTASGQQHDATTAKGGDEL